MSAIELTGEATRMPFIQDIIRSVPGLAEFELRRTLNTQEAVAIGCALMGYQYADFFNFKFDSSDYYAPRAFRDFP